jgi:hypothetical protein
VHIVKAFLGLNKMPKIFDIIENIAKNPSFDKDILIDLIKKNKGNFHSKMGRK